MKPGDGEDASGPRDHGSVVHQRAEVETAQTPADAQEKAECRVNNGKDLETHRDWESRPASASDSPIFP